MKNSASAINGLKGGRPQKYNRKEIIEMYEQGLSKNEIAAKLQCNWRTVHRILTNCKQFTEYIDKT